MENFNQIKKKIAILTDIHGQYSKVFELLDKYDIVIQNGDFSYDYKCLKLIDSNRLKINRGNHESHNQIKKYSHFLPWYGLQKFDELELFNIGGAFSIDWQIRIKKEFDWGKTWFLEEEMSGDEMEECLRQYKLVRPDFLLCHEAPRSIANIISNPQILKDFGLNPDTFTTRTSELLERCIQSHMPKLVYFSHYHKNFDQIINGCRFICQPELSFIEIRPDLTLSKFNEKGEEYV